MKAAFTFDGLFLHASAVVVEDRALLFLGHSTAGKSTLARLLGRRLPVLADDAVFALRGSEGDWRVVDGGFRFGRDELPGWEEDVRRRGAGESFRVGGCFRIHKATVLRAEPMEPLEAARHLMDAAMEIDVQRKFGRLRAGEAAGAAGALAEMRRMRRKWFGWVAEIARACPGWNLWFPKDFDGSEPVDFLAGLLK